MSYTANEKKGCSLAAIGIGGLLTLIIVAVVFIFLTEQVDATEQCAVTVWGVQAGEVGPGFHLTGPGTDYHCYTVRQITMELVAGDPATSNSKADYVDWAIKARTNDGIDEYSMLTLQYHVDRTAPINLYPQYPNDEAVKEQIVKSRLRSIVPQVLSLSRADDQYQGNLGPISDEIQKQLSEELKKFGITVDYFELKRSDFDDTYETHIRDRAGEVEAAKKKVLEQQTATNEAERQRIQAVGDEAAAHIAADKDAYVKRTNADAESYSQSVLLESRAKMIADHPELIEWERVQAINNAGAIYLPDTALPIYNVPTATPAG